MSRKKWPGSGGGDRVVKTRQSHTTARVKRGKFDGIFHKEVRARDVFATPRTGPCLLLLDVNVITARENYVETEKQLAEQLEKNK